MKIKSLNKIAKNNLKNKKNIFFFKFFIVKFRINFLFLLIKIFIERYFIKIKINFVKIGNGTCKYQKSVVI